MQGGQRFWHWLGLRHVTLSKMAPQLGFHTEPSSPTPRLCLTLGGLCVNVRAARCVAVFSHNPRLAVLRYLANPGCLVTPSLSRRRTAVKK